MIIYLDEEKAYRHWVTHHRRGFVLSGRNRFKPREIVLHRAMCSEVKGAASRSTHLTTGSQWKACALASQELIDWGRGCRSEFSSRPTYISPRPLRITAAKSVAITKTLSGISASPSIKVQPLDFLGVGRFVSYVRVF